MVLQQLDIHIQRKCFYLPYSKSNSKWIIDLNVKLKVLEFLEETIEEKFW